MANENTFSVCEELSKFAAWLRVHDSLDGMTAGMLICEIEAMEGAVKILQRRRPGVEKLRPLALRLLRENGFERDAELMEEEAGASQVGHLLTMTMLETCDLCCD